MGTLRSFSWNVAGIARNGVDDFISSFGKDHIWDVLLLQEFSGSKVDNNPMSDRDVRQIRVKNMCD